jgi:hypothetical protein
MGFIFAMGHVREASAAPQILAAVPVGGPLELVCHDTVCEAEFSAICLQPRRRLPARGTPYRVLAEDLGSVTLSGHTIDGRTVALPSTLLKVASLRGQTAVRFFVENDVLEQRGLQSVSVDFDRIIALLPVPTEDDSAPTTTADIVEAVSGIRLVGQVWTEFNADNMAIARITVRIGNGLPWAAPATNAESDRLFRLAVSHETAISAGALDSSRQVVALCQRRSQNTPMRTCLGDIHDQIMRSLNGKYWSALVPGS